MSGRTNRRNGKTKATLIKEKPGNPRSDARLSREKPNFSNKNP
jgi:hypothetical protein